jgi:hypothetical protein
MSAPTRTRYRPRERDPLTERILRIASRKGLFQRQLAQLAGIPENRFWYRVSTGAWSHDELHDLATALNERIDVVLDVTETL